ncbi:MAG TPA: TrpR-like protein, YerC/YecD [Candidatus Gallacutalibacter pullicola]|uniref:TrpR-like protein, YerC/YecD n=1 Tax=Candidatus Gallacutalibacter pullicola TaxID=2840830 RepID=A0A9D1DSM4_9FIRM|nr:TrpR-like protein, YerC/YecD [Candidatus Gallacutalibacter pullicola]
MNSKIKDDSVDFLFRAVLSLKTVEECYNFFEDLCTVPEIKAMSQRLLVAHMLSTKCVYSDIVAHTGASTATISRVNRSLNYGCDGYAMVFSRLDAGDAAADQEKKGSEE